MLNAELITKMKDCLEHGIKLLEPFENSGLLGEEALSKHREMLQILNEARDDMVLSPREPTEEMLNAAIWHYMNEPEDDRGALAGAYKAMISAAQNTEKG